MHFPLSQFAAAASAIDLTYARTSSSPVENAESSTSYLGLRVARTAPVTTPTFSPASDDDGKPDAMPVPYQSLPGVMGLFVRDPTTTPDLRSSGMTPEDHSSLHVRQPTIESEHSPRVVVEPSQLPRNSLLPGLSIVAELDGVRMILDVRTDQNKSWVFSEALSLDDQELAKRNGHGLFRRQKSSLIGASQDNLWQLAAAI